MSTMDNYYSLKGVFNVFTLSLFGILIILICVRVYLWTIQTYSFFRDLGMPYEKPKLLIGNLRNYPFISKNKHQFYFVEEIYKKHEGKVYVGMFKFRKPMLMVRDPVICNQILTKYFDKFRNRPGAPVDIFKDPLSNHLINMHGNPWKITRSKLSRAFTPSQLKMMFEDIMECVIELGDGVKTNDDVELIDLFSQFDLKVSGKCIIGLDSSDLNNPLSNYNVVFKNMIKPTLKYKSKQIFQFLFPQYSTFVETKNVSKEIYNFLQSVLKAEFQRSRMKKRHNFLNIIREIRSEELSDNNNNDVHKVNITKSIIMSNMFLFLSTGYESTSHTIAYVFYELALNPTIQEKVRQEVKEEYSQWSYKSIAKLRYLDQVIAESQRLHPVNTSLSRQCTAEKFKLPGTQIVIPRGTHICIPTFAMYKDCKYFPEPNCFNPDRFSGEIKNQLKIFLPFGEGPRQCLAKCYALLEIKCVVSYLILKFKCVPCSKTEIPLSYIPDKLFITPVNGIWVRFEKIETFNEL